VKFIYLLLLIYSFCPILVNKDCQLQAVITQALSCESTPPYLSYCMSRPSAHKTLVSVPFSAFSSRSLPVPSPLPSIRHHQDNGDCLEGKTENNQVCSVQHCVQQLCTHMQRPNGIQFSSQKLNSVVFLQTASIDNVTSKLR